MIPSTGQCSARDFSSGKMLDVRTELTISEFIYGKNYAHLMNDNLGSASVQELTQFNEANESLAALFFLFILMTTIQISTYIDLASHPHDPKYVIPALGLLSVLISMWVSFLFRCYRDRLSEHPMKSFLNTLYPYLKAYNIVATTAFFIARLYVRAYHAGCDNPHQLSDNWSCRGNGLENGMPYETIFVLLFFPIIFSVIYKEEYIRLIFTCWAGTIVSLFILIRLTKVYAFSATMILYILPSFVVMCEVFRYSRSLSLISHALRTALRERDENADQVHAAEMRHMIANVAHDLKTPLTSFLSGIELISEVALDCQKKVSENDLNPSYLLENVLSILNCVANIRNTNSFMLMTINRCIDYTKASKGLKLVPKYETIDVLETMSLPLLCMRDIQQRVRIMLQPIPKEVCSHIITDKQWLQENILCLLSNAVKYSSEGTVTVTVRLVSESEQDLEHQQIEERIREKPIARAPSRKSFSIYQVYPMARNTLVADQDDAASVAMSVDGFKNFHDHTGSVRSTSGRRSSTDQTLRDGANGFLLRIEIEDTGIGLSEEAMANLFNPFKQAQRLAGGTGLGLYSLARRLEALNGYYGVDHRRDGEQGSMFWFSIPYRPDRVSAGSLRRSIFPRRQDGLMTAIAAISDATGGGEFDFLAGIASIRSDNSGHIGNCVPRGIGDAPAVVVHTGSALGLEIPLTVDSATPPIPAVTSGDDSPIRLDILVVDDSPAIVKMTSMMLRRLGHNISIAENGDAALKKIWERLDATKTPFDVVLMDLQMPVMDGLEATRRLRAFEITLNSSSSDPTANSRRNLAPKRRSREMDRASFLTDTSSPSSQTGSHSSGSIHQYVIGVSANSDHETMQDAIRAGVDAFMAKPFSIETFYDTYEKMKCHKK